MQDFPWSDWRARVGYHRGAERAGADRLGPGCSGGVVSGFSAVDRSADPGALLAHLDSSARGLAAMKRYMAAAASRAVPGGLVLDIGSGAGHDLELLAAEELVPIGVEPSAVMIAEAARRLSAAGLGGLLVRADGHALPYASASLDGARIERVLQHCADPTVVLQEVRRVLRAGGFLAVFEPKWTSLRFGGEDADHVRVLNAVMHVRHPSIGAELPRLVRGASFRVLDRVSELSFGYSLASLPLRLASMLERAVNRDRIDSDTAERWWVRQDELDRQDAFEASWEKVLVVAEAA